MTGFDIERDPNEDLIGYTYVQHEGNQHLETTWHVVGTDPYCGTSYVEIREVDGDRVSVRPAGQMRRLKLLEPQS